MSGETSRMMALWRLEIAACRKSPVCQCSAAASGGLELCGERVRKVFDNRYPPRHWVAMNIPSLEPKLQRRELQMPGIVGLGLLYLV